jgi:hypothetical protein
MLSLNRVYQTHVMATARSLPFDGHAAHNFAAPHGVDRRPDELICSSFGSSMNDSSDAGFGATRVCSRASELAAVEDINRGQ